MKFLYTILGLILGIVGIVVAFLAIWGVCWVIEQISFVFPGIWAIAFVLFVIGMNVIAYFASYVWGRRKKWFFWACLVLTILGFTLPFLS